MPKRGSIEREKSFMDKEKAAPRKKNTNPKTRTIFFISDFKISPFSDFSHHCIKKNISGKCKSKTSKH
jgi:hypothetical protein